MRRLKPEFFIIGERKSGTSSVYRYLLDHPQVLPCKWKEPRFFSKPWWYRLLFMRWYHSVFPEAGAKSAQIHWYDLDQSGMLYSEVLTIHADPESMIMTGEASANTLAEVPPRRLYRHFPDAKLIVCLRHPVDRAFAHYRMLERFAKEGRRLPLHLTDFKQDFIEDIRRIRNGKNGYFSGPSFYSGHLKNWISVYGQERIFFIRTEDLNETSQAQRVMAAVCEFLELRQYDFTGILDSRVNVAPKVTLDPELRAALFAFYEEDIRELEMLTGRKFHWEP